MLEYVINNDNLTYLLVQKSLHTQRSCRISWLTNAMLLMETIEYFLAICKSEHKNHPRMQCVVNGDWRILYVWQSEQRPNINRSQIWSWNTHVWRSGFANNQIIARRTLFYMKIPFMSGLFASDAAEVHIPVTAAAQDHKSGLWIPILLCLCLPPKIHMPQKK